MLASFIQSMTPRKKAEAAFASAVLLLFFSGLAGFFTINSLLKSEERVIHTHEVRTALGELDSAVLWAGSARSGYVITGSEEYASQFESATREIPGKFRHLLELTRDNPSQQEYFSGLQDMTAQRVALLRESIRLRRQTPEDKQAQADIERQSVPFANAITSLMQQMRAEEQRLLQTRERSSRRLSILMVVTLVVAFGLALALLFLHYRLLSAELTARALAEQSLRDSEASLRRLTGRLLQIQDTERRKFSRELHDSLGQYLVAAKMNLEMYATQGEGSLLEETIQLLDQSISETRTISHLLHPPLLDEAGLSSAARWYMEGFARRSGIEVTVDLPDDLGRLPKSVALGLFRILQESLTNIHRHSNSPKAEIAIELLQDRVTLRVRDYGKGISAELLRNLQNRGTDSGVGLAGMRERVRELGGELSVQRCTPGTMISVTVPILKKSGETRAPAAD